MNTEPEEALSSRSAPSGGAGRRPSLVVNAFSNWVVLGVNMASGFLLTPFIIRSIGRDNYGILTLVASVVGYYGLLNVGVQSALFRYVARYAGQRDERLLNETVSTGVAMLLVPAVLGVAFSFMFAGWIGSFFNISPEDAQQFKYVMWLLGLSFGVSLAGGVFRIILIGHERFVLSNAIRIVETLLRAAATVIVLAAGAGLVGVVAVHLITAAAAISVSAAAAFRATGALSISSRLVNRTAAKALITFGVSSFLIGIANLLRFKLDSVVIGRFVDIGAVGVYGLGAMFIRHAASIIVSGGGVLMPRFSRLGRIEEGRDACNALLLRSMRYTAILSFGMLVPAVLCGRAFIERWVGADFAEAYPVIVVLLAGYAVALAQAPGLEYLIAYNKHHVFAFASLIEGVANVALSIALVSRYGIIGVAIGTTAPMLIVKVVVQPVYTSRITGIPIAGYLGSLSGPMLVALSLVTVGSLAVIPPGSSWPVILAAGAGYFLAYIMIVMLLVMPSEERHWALGSGRAFLRLKLAGLRQ